MKLITSDIDPDNFSTQHRIQGAPCATQAEAVNHECSGITFGIVQSKPADCFNGGK